MKKFGLTAGAIVVVSSLLSSNAWADRYHVSTAGICHAAAGSAINSFRYITPTGIRNPTGSALDIECPLPVHIRNAYSSVVGAGFSYVDLSSTDEIACTLYAGAHNGYNNQWDDFSTGVGAVNSAPAEADFDPANFYVIEGFWRMRCHIPAATINGQSGINTFWLITA